MRGRRVRLSIEPEPGRIPGEVNGEVGRTVNRHSGPRGPTRILLLVLAPKLGKVLRLKILGVVLCNMHAHDHWDFYFSSPWTLPSPTPYLVARQLLPASVQIPVSAAGMKAGNDQIQRRAASIPHSFLTTVYDTRTQYPWSRNNSTIEALVASSSRTSIACCPPGSTQKPFVHRKFQGP